MIAPDAIPVREHASVATLPPDAVRDLFGASATLRGSERLAVIQRGQVRAHVAVLPGKTLALHLDAFDASSMASLTSLRIQGPVGVLEAPTVQPIRSTLRVPEGLKAAWRMGDEATVGLGSLAVRVPVETGLELALSVDRALWLGAGSPGMARWLPQTTWAAVPDSEPKADPRIAVVPRRVVTETDVRQARLRRQRIRLAPGQIVTPAARSLAREHGVFTDDPT
jgi:hypothetical protein